MIGCTKLDSMQDLEYIYCFLSFFLSFFFSFLGGECPASSLNAQETVFGDLSGCLI